MTEAPVDCETLIVGAGVAGIGLGVMLRQQGLADFVILDKGAGIGGTWRDHTYPGLTVDVPALIFSYSFEPKPDWTSLWAPQAEVLEYLKRCVDKYGLGPHLRLGSEVVDASWDEHDRVWITRLRDGRTYTSRFLVNCSGYFSSPRLPDIEGLDGFEGDIIHTSAWPADADVHGKRVGFIGTGATGIQLAPEVARIAEQLHVFQRTPVWLLPKPPLRLPKAVQRLFARVPLLQRATRLVIFALTDALLYRMYIKFSQVAPILRLIQKLAGDHVRRQVADPELRRKLTPSYTWGCKRGSFSNDYFPMFAKPNVELVTDGIERITRDSVVTSDGTVREVDVLICATGYIPFEKAALPTYPLYGRGGLDVREYWDQNRYQGFRGFAVHGFPNFFMIFGPYSIIGLSYHAMVEVAARNIIRCITGVRERGGDTIEVTAQAQAAELAFIDQVKHGSIFWNAQCGPSNTFYIDRFGDTPGFRPVLHHKAWWQSRTLSMEHFEITGRTVAGQDAGEPREAGV